MRRSSLATPTGRRVAGHLVQFASILLGLAGLVVLARALRPGSLTWLHSLVRELWRPWLRGLSREPVDGVALKLAVDASIDAPPADEATRFGNAETVLWTGRGMQSSPRRVRPDRVLLGVAVAVSRRLAPGSGRWPWRRVRSPWRLESTSRTGAPDRVLRAVQRRLSASRSGVHRGNRHRGSAAESSSLDVEGAMNGPCQHLDLAVTPKLDGKLPVPA